MLSGRLLCRWVISHTSEMKDPVLDHMWKEAEGSNYLSFWTENTSHVVIWYLSSRFAVLPVKKERSTVIRWFSRSPSSGWRRNRPQWSCICQVRNICQTTIVAPLKAEFTKCHDRHGENSVRQTLRPNNKQTGQQYTIQIRETEAIKDVKYLYISFVCISRC